MKMTRLPIDNPALFNIKGILANPHIQSMLASSRLRKRLQRKQSRNLEKHQKTLLLDAGEGVRLHAYYSPQVSAEKQTTLPKNHAHSDKLVILIHGWEGSAQSTYLLSAASTLYNQGFSVLRLHLRDHGPSAHLNDALFHAARLDEVCLAIKDAQNRLPSKKTYLVGFSLGGNFALRISLEARKKHIDLEHVVAISPVFSPEHTMQALAEGPSVYRRYFLKKWKRALLNKQYHFPDRYDFNTVLKSRSLTELTKDLVEKYTEFTSIEAYYRHYSIDPVALEQTPITTDVILAADDPVIPFKHIDGFSCSENFRFRVFDHGGHCGFIQNWRFDSWIDSELIRLFNEQDSCHQLTRIRLRNFYETTVS